MSMFEAKTRLALIVVGFASVMTMAGPAKAVPSPGGDAVWDWDTRCSSPKQIRIEVVFDGGKIYESTFGICHLTDYSQPMKRQRTLVFKVAAPHKSLFGEPKKEPLEGNVWEAGRDPNDILLGISLAGPKRVWLNSLHILNPNKVSETPLARGLIVRTIPETRRARID